MISFRFHLLSFGHDLEEHQKRIRFVLFHIHGWNKVVPYHQGGSRIQRLRFLMFLWIYQFLRNFLLYGRTRKPFQRPERAL